ENDQFREIMQNEFGTLFTPLGFVKGSQQKIYALSNQNRDKSALVEFDVKSGEELRLIYENEKGDLSSDGYSIETESMAFTTSFVDKDRKVIFDPAYKEVYEYLTDQFEGSEVEFIDSDASLEGFIVRVYSDVHPGKTYYINRVSKKLKILSEENPKLTKLEFNAMEEVEFLSRDGKSI